MVNLRGERVILRAVEPADVEIMYGVENDLRNWSVSGTTAPFSRYILEQFIDTQRDSVYSSRQLRLMIENLDHETIGMVDIFDFDPMNHRAGVGILIFDSYRSMGYGVDSLETLHSYCKKTLQLHQLWCDVAVDNIASLKLFAKAGYNEVGRKREWLLRDGLYCDEIMFQKILTP